MAKKVVASQKKEVSPVDFMKGYLEKKGITADGKFFSKEKYDLLLKTASQQKNQTERYMISCDPPTPAKSNFEKIKNDVTFSFEVNKGKTKDGTEALFSKVLLTNNKTHHHLDLNSKFGKELSTDAVLNLLTGKTVGIKDYSYISGKGTEKEAQQTKDLWVKLFPKSHNFDKNSFIIKDDKFVGIMTKQSFKGMELSQENVQDLMEGNRIEIKGNTINFNLDTFNKEAKKEKELSKGIKI